MDQLVAKVCSVCGKEYSLDEFRALPRLPGDIADPSICIGFAVEMRNCKCGGTLAIELEGDNEQSA